MTKILVVGNSVDVLAHIERLTQDHQGSEIIVFATEGFLPYDRAQLPSLVAGLVKEVNIYPYKDQYFKERHIELITGEQLARISVKRQHLTTERKRQINYDQLVLADTGVLILPPIKGQHKEGVFDPWRLTSVKAMMKHVAFVDNVMVVVTNMQGFNMACALHHLKKEVTIISSGPGLLPAIFDEETGALLKQLCESKGMRVYGDNAVEEILGDAEIKAVKLKSSKVLASEMVILDEARADIRMLSEPTLTDRDAICIEDCFKPVAMPLPLTHFGLKVLDGFFFGWTMLPDDGREYLKFDGPQNVYKKIIAQGDHLVGSILFNSPEDINRLTDLIQLKQPIAGNEENLL